ALRRWLSGNSGLRREDYLHAFIVFILEDVVADRCPTELHAMGDDERRIDLASLDPVQQWAHVALHMALARFDGQRSIHHRTHREFVDEAAVYADGGDDAAV